MLYSEGVREKGFFEIDQKIVKKWVFEVRAPFLSCAPLTKNGMKKILPVSLASLKVHFLSARKIHMISRTLGDTIK